MAPGYVIERHSTPPGDFGRPHRRILRRRLTSGVGGRPRPRPAVAVVKSPCDAARPASNAHYRIRGGEDEEQYACRWATAGDGFPISEARRFGRFGESGVRLTPLPFFPPACYS